LGLAKRQNLLTTKDAKGRKGTPKAFTTEDTESHRGRSLKSAPIEALVAEVCAKVGRMGMRPLKPTPNWDDLGYIGRGYPGSGKARTYHGGTETRIRNRNIGKTQKPTTETRRKAGIGKGKGS
jgi:hypothetical protein